MHVALQKFPTQYCPIGTLNTFDMLHASLCVSFLVSKLYGVKYIFKTHGLLFAVNDCIADF